MSSAGYGCPFGGACDGTSVDSDGLKALRGYWGSVKSDLSVVFFQVFFLSIGIKLGKTFESSCFDFEKIRK